MNVIKVDNLTKKYGDFTAVDHVSSTVEKGTLLGFLGVNSNCDIWARRRRKARFNVGKDGCALCSALCCDVCGRGTCLCDCLCGLYYFG